MSWEQLVQWAAQIQQTNDGEFIAFSSDIERATITDEDLDLGQFPTSKAQLAVLAIDSTYFEVYAKDPDVLVALRRSFRDVRLEDPSPYFYGE